MRPEYFVTVVKLFYCSLMPNVAILAAANLEAIFHHVPWRCQEYFEPSANVLG